MAETKEVEYRWLPSDAGYRKDHGCADVLVRYRFEDGHLVYDPEPPAPPPVSEPVVDEERWAFVSSPTDGIRLRYRGFRPPNKDSRWKLLHVRSAAADEALKAQHAYELEEAGKTAKELYEAVERLSALGTTLTRERDEARAELETTKTKAGNQISVEKIHAETNRAAVREMCAGITEALGSPMPLTVSGSLKAVREAAARIADLERQVGEERIGRVRFREAIHEALKACDESSFASIEDTLKAAISCDGEIPALYPDIETEVLTLRERTHSLERQLAAKSTLDQQVMPSR